MPRVPMLLFQRVAGLLICLIVAKLAEGVDLVQCALPMKSGKLAAVQLHLELERFRLLPHHLPHQSCSEREFGVDRSTNHYTPLTPGES